MSFKFYNTLNHKKEEFKPLIDGQVSMYSCGPTVYWRVHTGNLRAYSSWDFMIRAFKYTGQKIHRIINFTDVGHMVADEDMGDDKIDKQAKSQNIDPFDIANTYIISVLVDFKKFNILGPNGEEIDETIDIKSMDKEKWATLGWARATDHIEEMIEIIKKIEENGYTYATSQALYFDVTKFPEYTNLSLQPLNDKQVGVREEVGVDPEKKHPADFVLWMKNVGKYKDHLMHWQSPWGVGFPGWHIECSAMGTKYLGEYFDIHTGGTDHIPVHHANEIAQNYGAFKHHVVNYWIHNEMLVSADGEKASKSKKNVYLLEEIEEMGFDPMDLRYYFLTVNYHVPIRFSIEGLEGSRKSRISLVKKIFEIAKNSGADTSVEFSAQLKISTVIEEYRSEFISNLEDNLNTSGALAVVSKLLKSSENSFDIIATIIDFDKVFGLRIEENVLKLYETEGTAIGDIPVEVADIVRDRDMARQNKDWAKSDVLRDQLIKMGWNVKDTQQGTQISKI
ncbi:MAG TPA: cysteine--tRNA ligase [Candidatus Dojkabacteria bacterium]|nr:cysteine--tRNA ligase [Candidatus Dojkabacteria bacterium]